MLSRVAERIYWLGRYVERAENTTRILNVSTNLLLDLPRNVRLGWRTLVEITGSVEQFDARFQNCDERNVVRYLLGDLSNPGSVLSAINMARENARTAREILPFEAWERINDIYLLLRDRTAAGVGRSERPRILQQIITGCQAFTGFLEGCMSHESAYTFVSLGQNLERADMSTRILDVGSARLLSGHAGTALRPEEQAPYTNVLWMSVLRSLSAYQMYRQHVQDRVNAEDVLIYLLQNRRFPRAVAYCLKEIESYLGELPRHEEALRQTVAIERRVHSAAIPALLESGLHEFIDDLELGYAAIHDQIAATWFLPVTR